MGEYSKRIGEIGEEIIANFLDVIGWSNSMQNFDIPSVDPEKHGKKTNGIDGFFHYRSPMITDALENIIYSVKFSNEKYKINPVDDFKKYYVDLACAIESFKKSEIRNDVLNKLSGIQSVFDRGVLFWINNVDLDESNLNNKLLKIEIPKNYNHNGIILVDNRKMGFIFDSVQFVRNKWNTSEIEFSYFSSGMNNDDENRRNGKVLPVEYLSSNILPFRVQNPTTREVTFVLCSSENFESDELIKLLGLAKNIGTNMQTNTLIAFPDYNKSIHKQIVDRTKQSFDDITFVNGLEVVNFNTNFRN